MSKIDCISSGGVIYQHARQNGKTRMVNLYVKFYHMIAVTPVDFKEIDQKIKSCKSKLSRAIIIKHKIEIARLTKQLDTLLTERKQIELMHILSSK